MSLSVTVYMYVYTFVQNANAHGSAASISILEWLTVRRINHTKVQDINKYLQLGPRFWAEEISDDLAVPTADWLVHRYVVAKGGIASRERITTKDG